MSVVSLEEGFDVGCTELATSLNVFLQQKALELATFGQQFAARVASITFGLETAAKPSKWGAEQTTPEIDQSAFLFEPGFEHKIVVEKDGGKVNDHDFRGEGFAESLLDSRVHPVQ